MNQLICEEEKAHAFINLVKNEIICRLTFHKIICRCESRLLRASTTRSGLRRSGLRSVALFGRRGTAASQPRSVTTLRVPGWPPPHSTSSPNHSSQNNIGSTVIIVHRWQEPTCRTSVPNLDRRDAIEIFSSLGH